MNFKDSKAIYLQIAEYVFEQILLGKWPLDEKIPSVRDLAVSLEVNPNTVMRTYDVLQTQEIVYNKRGIGFFIAENAIDKIKAYRKQQFIEQELPVVFKNIYLLNISLDELKDRYQNFVNQHYKTEPNEN